MKKKWIFNFLNDIGVSSLLRNRKKNKLTVLSLHRVSTETDPFWNPLHPNTFELLLQYLQKYYHVISFADIENISRPSECEKPFIILSFDDGYYDFYEHALPLLVKYNVPCNHNIVNDCAANNRAIWTQRMNNIFTHCFQNSIELNFEAPTDELKLSGFNSNWMDFYLYMYRWMLRQPTETRMSIIEKKEQALSIETSVRMMNWKELADCVSNKVEIGSHTYTHEVLSMLTDDAVLRKEIVTSTIEMKEQLKINVNVLALPNSENNKEMDKYASECGLRYILYVENNINSWKHVKAADNRNVDRINIVEEPLSSMILRTEYLHAKLKQYV